MVKKTKHRQYGAGFWPFSNDNTNVSTSSWSDWFASIGQKTKEGTNNILNQTENVLSKGADVISNTASSALENTEKILNTEITTTQPTSTNSYTPTSSTYTPTSSTYTPTSSSASYGGKKRSRKNKHRKRKHTKRTKRGGGLGLMYYATPVHNIQTAQPTYQIKGGKKTRKNRRKH